MDKRCCTCGQDTASCPDVEECCTAPDVPVFHRWRPMPSALATDERGKMSKTTSLELSKALKEAGAKQASERHWYEIEHVGYTDKEIACTTKTAYRVCTLKEAREQPRLNIGFNRLASSFDCHELFERLPDVIEHGDRIYDVAVSKIADEEEGQYYYTANFWNEVSGTRYLAPMPYCDTPAEALGRLYRWLLENGHCKE